MHRVRVLFVLGCLLLIAPRASAYCLEPDRWPDRTLVFAYGFLDPSWGTSLVDAMREWSHETTITFVEDPNAVPGCDRASGLPLNGAEFGGSTCDGTPLGATTLAVAQWTETGGVRTASGVVFNSDQNWGVYDGNLSQNFPDFRRVAVHELGHVIGLCHELTQPSIMYPFIGNRIHVEPDDVAGVLAMYPAPPGVLLITPSTGLTSSGHWGTGPFSPTSQVYTLTNGGGQKLIYRVLESTSWLSTSHVDGSLGGGESQQIAVSLNSEIFSLLPGQYSATVEIRNASSPLGRSYFPAELTVTGILVPSVDLISDKLLVAERERVKLSWTSADATSCTASGDSSFNGPKSLAGSTTVSVFSTRTYTMTCENASASASDEVTVTALPSPIVSLSANPKTVAAGAESTISWTTQHADSCTGWNGEMPVSGSDVVTLGSTNESFSLTCSNAAASGSATTTVSVVPPPVVDLTATHEFADPGALIALYWQSMHATSCVASGGWANPKALSGNQIALVYETTSYTLTCSNLAGSVSDTVIVTVPAPGAMALQLSSLLALGVLPRRRTKRVRPLGPSRIAD